MNHRGFKFSLLFVLVMLVSIGCSPSETRGRLFSYTENEDIPMVRLLKKPEEWLGVFHINPPKEVKKIKIKAKYTHQHQWKTKELADIKINPDENQGAIDLMVAYDYHQGRYIINYSSDYITMPIDSQSDLLHEVKIEQTKYQVVEGDVWLDVNKEYVLMGNGSHSEEIYQISQEFDQIVLEQEEGMLFFVIECEI